MTGSKLRPLDAPSRPSLRVEGKWPRALGYSYPAEEPAEDSAEAPSRADKLAAADAATVQRGEVMAVDGVGSCPAQQRQAVEVVVVDEGDRPIADAEVELRRSDTEAIVAKTDVHGWLRIDGLEAGRYTLGLAGLHRDAWELLGCEALPDDQVASSGDASWEAPARPRAATVHVVEQGEGISDLALRYGLTRDALWAANADLKELRHAPNLLAPGDRAEVPAIEPKQETASLGQLHRLRRTATTELLQLRFLDADGKPRAGVPYLLTIHGSDGDELREGKTDGSGQLDEAIDPEVDRVTLRLGKDQPEDYELGINHLDPVDTIAGAQARLLALGYPIDLRELGERTPYGVRALRDFQRDAGLEPTGELDDATIAALEKEHRS